MWQQSLDLTLAAHKGVINGDGAVAFADLIVGYPKKYDINVLPEEIKNNPKYREGVKAAGFKPISTQHPALPPQQPPRPAALYSPYPPNPYHQQTNYYGYHNVGHQYGPSSGYHHGYNYNHNQYNGNHYDGGRDYDSIKCDDKRGIKENKEGKKISNEPEAHELYVSE